MFKLVKIGVSVVALLLCGTGCAATSSRLKARFAREQRCPEQLVAVSEEGGDVYRASGCDRSTEYVCGAFAGFGDPSQSCRVRGLNPQETPGRLPPQPQLVNRPDLEPPK